MPASARLLVDLNALSANFHTLARIGGAQVHPVVKADAYGLGAAAIARKLMTEGAEAFFVARLAEGEALRQTLGSRPDIYVLDGCGPQDVLRLQAAQLRPVLNAPEQIRRWLGSDGGPCALQIDTGMNRLGIRPEDAPDAFSGLKMVLSHLACADDPFDAMNAAQRAAFELVSRRYPDAIRSFANAGGTFLGSDYAFDALRPGISLYGGGPEGRPDDRLKPVVAFRAEVLQVRETPEGETVGYARGYTATAPIKLAIAGVGYADGVLRSNYPHGKVWVGGELRPIVGRISMDLLAVDVTDLKVAPGDQIELFGPHRPIDDAAADAGTIAYELITSVSARVPRIYVG